MAGKGKGGTAEIKGRVFDEKRRPIGGVSVACDGLETLTLFDGTFEFKDLTEGPHSLEACLEGYQSHHVKTEVKKETETTVVINMELVKGSAKICGYILEVDTGKPVSSGGSMTLIRHSSNKISTIDPKTGYYQFIELAPGEYKIWTSVIEYVDEKKTLIVTEEEEVKQDFFIRRKMDIEPPWG